MSDEPELRRGQPGHRAAVARLAEVLAETQAVARATTSGDDDAPVDAQEDPSAGPSDQTGHQELSEESLQDRVAALDEIDRRADQESFVGASRRARRFWPLYSLFAVLVLAVPLLIAVGYHLTSQSTTGEVLSGVSRPNAPGYTALVEPTPVALVLQVDRSGNAQSITLLSLSGPDGHGGAVVVVPLNTRLSKPRYGVRTFRGVVGLASAKTAGAAIGKELGLGFTEVIKVKDDEFSQFVAPVEPLTIDNPADVTTPDGELIPEGRRELSAAETTQYLAGNDAQESVDGRLARQELVWRAWIAAIAKTKGRAGAVPGETQSGLGFYLKGLAAGTVKTAMLPTDPAGELDGSATVAVDVKSTRLMIANAVPFPVGATQGSRVTVSLLNGTGPDAAPISVIQRLTYAGAQITSMGNAAKFGTAPTTLTYSDPKVKSRARSMAAALGVGRVVRVPNADINPQVTIVMGRDLLAHPPDPLTMEDVGR